MVRKEEASTERVEPAKPAGGAGDGGDEKVVRFVPRRRGAPQPPWDGKGPGPSAA